MSSIRLLPPAVVNKIAAGEVIERPASAVKELLENSVDAGATRIDVRVTKGGCDLVQVTDNGCGIPPEDLPLAVASHTTSKLRTADDLFQVATMGFRGEALASMAEVSQFCLRSRTAESTAGAELEVHGGVAGEVLPCAAQIGTQVTLRNLFFNTPVRRKFLRTTQTEMGHVTEALTRIALAHDHVHFALHHNERPIYELPPVSDWRDRIVALFGDELAENLIEVESQQDGLGIYGFVANPSYNRGNNRMQYLFLNRRYIRDRALSHALSEAYRGLLMTGRFAVGFLQLQMPPDQVDVNVHPTKMEVRFENSGQIYGQLLGMLRSRFLSTDLTARADLSDQRPESSPLTAAGGTPSPHGSASPTTASGWERESWNHPAASRPPQSAGAQTAFELQVPPLDLATSEPAGMRPRDSHPPVPPFLQTISPERTSPPAGVPAVTAVGSPAMQVYNRYLITETSEGVVVIDQHALHERILYEEIRQKVLAENVEVQRLLVPEPVQLTAAEAAAVLENRQTLSQLGIHIEPFGGDTILLSAYPAMLANLNPAELLQQVAELSLVHEKKIERRDLLDELLHMVACKAAIKAGDRLTSAEISALIGRRHLVQDAHHCPHGRPTTLVFTREELDRRFKRT